ncbi:urease accessory protein [Mesorhizobium albiziae]|uniref:Urease accessory protein UreD n=1 Tax=Neomesorhizobium albiziae TaxID=335020 RepID=A0A1I3YBP0_9HYPH|nr:urease accessory protein UreD [Mesorhizobium albiziae]GLS29993.1 urease accessory protein UreD [Mesorhizobium albiziae]SFK28616.1 urease accessory protein [Mesorhizobium albiziae]
MTNHLANLEPQRVSARAELSISHLHGRPRLSRLYQEGAAKIRLPRVDDGPLEAVLINTAGGLTGGDRLHWSVDVGTMAAATITTQACEKVYRAGDGRAEVSCGLSVGAGGRLAWLPQETIVFERAAFSRHLDADLGDGAEALIVEATVFGRRAMGEAVGHAMFRDRWRIRRNGRLIHAEDFAIGPDVAGTLSRAAVTGGDIAVATVLLICDDAPERLEAARAIVGDEGGVSAWSVGQSGKLLARLFATDSYTLRKRLVPLIELLNGQAGLPKIWSL